MGVGQSTGSRTALNGSLHCMQAWLRRLSEGDCVEGFTKRRSAEQNNHRSGALCCVCAELQPRLRLLGARALLGARSACENMKDGKASEAKKPHVMKPTSATISPTPRNEKSHLDSANATVRPRSHVCCDRRRRRGRDGGAGRGDVGTHAWRARRHRPGGNSRGSDARSTAQQEGTGRNGLQRCGPLRCGLGWGCTRCFGARRTDGEERESNEDDGGDGEGLDDEGGHAARSVPVWRRLRRSSRRLPARTLPPRGVAPGRRRAARGEWGHAASAGRRRG